MECPNCRANSADGAAECPSCGVIFAKWQAAAAAKAAAAAVEGSSATATKPSSSTATAVLMPLLYLAVTFGAAFGLYRFDSSRRAKAGPEGAFDPEPHRAAISALEQAIYKEEGPAYKVAESVERSAQALAEELREKYRFRADKVAGPLWEFAAGPGASAQALGHVPGERARWIRDWEEIRARHFMPATWFHAPVAVDPAKPPLAVPEAADRLEKAAFGLAALLAAAEQETKDFGEREVNLADLDQGTPNRGQALQDLERWRAWVPSWHARVKESASAVPAQKEVPKELWRVKELLHRVVLEMLAVPNPGAGKFLMESELDYSAVYIPSRHSRDAWLGNMKNWLGEARKMNAEASRK